MSPKSSFGRFNKCIILKRGEKKRLQKKKKREGGGGSLEILRYDYDIHDHIFLRYLVDKYKIDNHSSKHCQNTACQAGIFNG